MKYDVVVEIARPELLAAVRATIPLIDIPRTWKPALDRVWAFLKTHGDLDPGHIRQGSVSEHSRNSPP
jgi:hypothetical protein